MVNSGILPFGARQTPRYDDSVIRSIPGLKLWFDATKLPVMNDGTPVATWPDMSGNGYDVTQATEANQALYYNNIFNGKPALKFNGTSQYYENTVSDPFAAGAARTVFVVAKCDATIGVFICFRRSSLVWCYQFLDNGTRPGLFFTDGSNVSSYTWSKTEYAVLDSMAILCIRSPGTGSQPKLRVNGYDATISGGSTPNSESGTTGFNIGKSDDSEYMSGYIAEIISYNSHLTDAQCLQVEKYLAAKYMTIAQ